MAKEEFKKLKKDWRNISLYDRFRSAIFATPATFGEYSKTYSDFVIKVVGEGECLGVNESGHYLMFMFKGERIDFRIKNYPFAYAEIKRQYNKFDYSSRPNWEAVLTLRKKQLQYKEQFLADWLKEREV